MKQNRIRSESRTRPRSCFAGSSRGSTAVCLRRSARPAPRSAASNALPQRGLHARERAQVVVDERLPGQAHDPAELGDPVGGGVSSIGPSVYSPCSSTFFRSGALPRGASLSWALRLEFRYFQFKQRSESGGPMLEQKANEM